MTKPCPYCAEEIQEAAVKCKHCMEFLDESRRPVPAVAAPVDGVPWYCKTGFIILIFLTVPPFALPLVWLHPKLKVIWKIVFTVVVLLISWGMYHTLQLLLQQFDEARKMLEGMTL